MEKSGLSQAKFAESVGIHPVSFCNYLKEDSFSSKMIQRIAEKLNIPYTDLLPDDSKEKIAPNVVGYLEYNGEIVKIKDLKELKKFVERVDTNMALMNIKQVKLPKQRPITLADIDLSKKEEYDASQVQIKSFRHGYDIVDDAAYPLGNMCPGFPFELNGVPFFSSEAAYIAGIYSNDTPEHKRLQRKLVEIDDGYKAKKEYRNKRYDDIMRKDWEEYNVEWMKYVVWQKCQGNKDFADLLKKTPDETMIVENSTGMNAPTAGFWGCTNQELEDIRNAKEELYKRKYPKAKKEDLIIERNKWHNFGVWSGTNEMGKILKMCSLCLKHNLEMPIDYEILNAKHIHLLGQELHFENKNIIKTTEEKKEICRSDEGYCLLFDLDNTLINSDAKRPYLQQKPLNWKSIDGCIPEYRIYDGILEVLQWAKEKGIKVGIVSSTKRGHIDKVLKHFNITDYFDLVIGNQRGYKKPHPKLIENALEGLGIKAENALYIGDHDVDAEMCARAKVRFVGCTWDSWHKKELVAIGCRTISKPQEIMGLFDDIDSISLIQPKTTPVSRIKKVTKKTNGDISKNANNTEKATAQTEERVYGIIGAVIGDIVGSRFEFKDVFPRYKFKFIGANNKFTDDSILTIAIADALLHNKSFADSIWDWAKKYPYAGWGGGFRRWLKGSKDVQNKSIGNGCGMRISPVGFYANTLEETLEIAKEATIPTHNSMDGIKGAQAIASAVFLARQKKSKEEIKEYVEKTFGYNLDLTKDDIVRLVNSFAIRGEGEWARNSIPVAIIAFLNGTDYESVIRTAITYGGDSDTIACMAGGIAAAYYGVPIELAKEVVRFLDEDLLSVINDFDKTSFRSDHITPPDTSEWNKDCVIVYGSSVIEGINGEAGSYEAHKKGKKKGFPIRTIGVDFAETEKDVKELVAFVEQHPEKTFLVKKVGLSDKSNIGKEKMAPLFKPLKEKTNVYLPVEFRE